jgi:peptidyl-prolyl cis-trans isomerase D
LAVVLAKIRRHAYSWTTRALLILLTAVFMFWGVGTGFFARVHPVATVDGRNILPKDLDRAAERIRKTMENLYGANAAAMIKATNVRQMAVEQLINEMLAEQEASRLGLRISKTALEQAIASQSAFQVGGEFDFRAYREVLRENDLTPADFETSTRSRMLVDALRQMVANAVQVSDEEARREFNQSNSELSVAYIEIPYQSFVAEVKPTEKQIADFYSGNREAFRTPDQVKIAFVRYDPLKMAANQTPTDKEITDYYNENRAVRFSHPEQVHISHILIRLPKGASEKDKAQARATAADIVKKLDAGADFAQLARQYSDDDATRLKGGDLGFYSRGELLKPMEDAAFKLKPGQTTIVETKAGFHILRLDGIRPAENQTLAQARPEIIETLRRAAGTELAHQALEEDLAAALNGKNLNQLAEKHGLKAVETGFFPADQPPPEIADNQKLVKDAFKMEVGEVQAITGAQTPYLVKMVQRKPSHVPPLKEIEDLVRETLVRMTAESKAQEAASRVLKQIRSSADFDKVAIEGTMPVRNAGPFPENGGTIPGIGEFPQAIAAAAVVPKLPGVVQRVLEKGGNAYIFEVIDRTPPSDAQWKAAAPSFKKELLQERRMQAWVNFINALKSRAQIVVHTDLIGEQPAEAPM